MLSSRTLLWVAWAQPGASPLEAVHTHSGMSVGYRHLRQEGLKVHTALTVSHPPRARPRQLHTASPRGSGLSRPYCRWTLRSLPRVSSRDSAEATTVLRPSLRSPRTSALPRPHDEENIVVCPHSWRGGPESTHFLSSFFTV